MHAVELHTFGDYGEGGRKTAECIFEIRYSDTGNATHAHHIANTRQKRRQVTSFFRSLHFRLTRSFICVPKCPTTTAVLTGEATTVGGAVAATEATATATTAMAVGTATVAEIVMAVKVVLVDMENKSKL